MKTKNSISFKERWNFVRKGTPMTMEYSLNETEEEFRKRMQLLITNEDDFHPLYMGSKRFAGGFHGHFRREFSIKPKSRFSLLGSVNPSRRLWANGLIQDQQGGSNIRIKVSYHRSGLEGIPDWLPKFFIGSFLVFIAFLLLAGGSVTLFLKASAILLVIYLIYLLISAAQIPDQIKYFEEYFDPFTYDS